jgi:hypothetical protein
VTAALAGAFASLGARAVGERVYEWEGRRWQAEVETPGIFGGPLGLTVALFTDRVHEFYVRRAGGLPAHPLPELASDEFYREYSIEGRAGPAVRDYLQRPDVKEILRHLLPGRWKTFGKGFVILYVSDNVFPAEPFDERELKLAMMSLLRLDQAIDDPIRGGAFTFRSGFEDDLPPWHWSRESVRALPADVTRAVVSYYHDNPYLNEGLVDLFRELAGRSRVTYYSGAEDLDFVRHAFGSAVTRDGTAFESDRLDALAAADQYLDGGFFAACVASDRPPDALRGLRRFELHEAALRTLPDVDFYVRRLLDDEASWFSGEYEILSLRLTARDIASALNRVAARYDAKIMPLERRFTLKVFRDEKFEYST